MMNCELRAIYAASFIALFGESIRPFAAELSLEPLEAD